MQVKTQTKAVIKLVYPFSMEELVKRCFPKNGDSRVRTLYLCDLKRDLELH